jgi:multifunctional methyltransferase subunit TRM112
MRLITHNMIMCTVKGCTTNNFPLKIKATSVQKEEAELNENFMKHMFTKLDWPAVVSAAKDVCNYRSFRNTSFSMFKTFKY